MGHGPLRPPPRRADTMGMVAPLYYTADMVRALPSDGNKYEVVHGELLVTPAARFWHHEVAQRLTRALQDWCARTGIGHAVGLPGDISWGPDTLVQPDVFVVPLDEARTLDWARMQHLLLAVEILSPSSARADRFTKRRLYQEVGVPLYWVIDADALVAEVWTPDTTFPTFERERLVWHPAGAGEPFMLELEELFRPI